MEEFVNSVNAFLAFRKYDILHDKGRISNKAAVNKANEEFDIYNKNQKIFSDFDKEIKNLNNTAYYICNQTIAATSPHWLLLVICS